MRLLDRLRRLVPSREQIHNNPRLAWMQKFDTLLVKSRFPRPGLLMNSRTYLCF